MKILTTALLAASLLLPVARADSRRPLPTHQQMVNINDAYVPQGLDSHADAFVVIAGLFPNSCYRFLQATVWNVRPGLQEVRAFAEVTEGVCLMVLVPFQQKVPLGQLSSGEHTVRFVNGDGTHWDRKLTVE